MSRFAPAGGLSKENISYQAKLVTENSQQAIALSS